MQPSVVLVLILLLLLLVRRNLQVLIEVFDDAEDVVLHELEVLAAVFEHELGLVFGALAAPARVQLRVEDLLSKSFLLNLDSVRTLSDFDPEFLLSQWLELFRPRPVQLNRLVHIRRLVSFPNIVLLMLRSCKEVPVHHSLMHL